MRHLYKITLEHDDIYNDSSVLPAFCIGYIIRDTNVIVTYCDEPCMNTVPTANLVAYLTTLRVALPEDVPHCKRKIDKHTLWYEQADISVLCELYRPLAFSLANRIVDSCSFFTLDDLVQEAYLVIAQLYKKGYYVHGALMRRAFVNHVRILMRKEPLHWDVVSLQQFVRKAGDGESVLLEETIEDPASGDFIDSILLTDEELSQKEQLLTIISKRQYDQLVREYRTHTVPTSMGKKIKDLRRKLGLE